MRASQIVPQMVAVLGVVARVCVGSEGLVSTSFGTSLTGEMHAPMEADESATAALRIRARDGILRTHIKVRDASSCPNRSFQASGLYLTVCPFATHRCYCSALNQDPPGGLMPGDHEQNMGIRRAEIVAALSHATDLV